MQSVTVRRIETQTYDSETTSTAWCVSGRRHQTARVRPTEAPACSKSVEEPRVPSHPGIRAEVSCKSIKASCKAPSTVKSHPKASLVIAVDLISFRDHPHLPSCWSLSYPMCSFAILNTGWLESRGGEPESHSIGILGCRITQREWDCWSKRSSASALRSSLKGPPVP